MAGEAAAAKKYQDGELLIKFKAGASEQAKKNLHKKHGAEKLKAFAELRLHHVKLKQGMTVEDAVKEYQADPDVEYAEPNYLFSIQSLPNDAKFSEQWALNNTGQTGGAPGADIKAPAAWSITTGSSNVVVAILDTGIDYTHPDLAANIYSNIGYNAVNNSSDVYDYHGHGTHVAGIIGAVGNNGLGVTGVNWNVKLTACKCADNSGYVSTDRAISCLQWVKSLKDSGVNIVATNNSWANNAYNGSAIADAVKAQPDILFIAAAGNGGYAPEESGLYRYPDSNKQANAIIVAASDDKDHKSTFSNFGRYDAHLTAPGDGILSTLPANNKWQIPGKYGSLSGTSQAAPFVTGVAALLKAQDPSRTAATIKNLILSGGDDTAGSYGRTLTGKRLNAYGSLTCTSSPVFAVLNPPRYWTPGSKATLSAMSINCGTPVGPVTVTTRDGQVVTLTDDGVAPDAAANDGIFTASYLLTRADEVLVFSSPAGSQTIEYPLTTITYSGINGSGVLASYPGPAVATSYLLGPMQDVPYSNTLAVLGGYAPYQWRLVGGALPPGITLTSSGEVTGSASASGNYYFTAEVTDAYGAKGIREFLLAVTPPGYTEAWRKLPPAWASQVSWDRIGGLETDVAIDRDGNTYVSSTGYIGEQSAGLVKYDADGNQVWSKIMDYEAYETLSGVAVDAVGNVYAGGYSGLMGQALLLKIDADGNELWRRNVPSGMLVDLAADASGNVYVSAGPQIVKYDAAGNQLWAKEMQLPTYALPQALSIDAAGNVYLTGYSGNSSRDVMLAKYDSAGSLLWYKSYDNGGNDTGLDVAVNSLGEIYLATTTQASASTTQASASTGYLMKLDPAGNLLWSKSYAAGKGSKFSAVALDSLERPYVAGSLQSPLEGKGDFLVLKYDADGSVLWTTTVDLGAAEEGERIAIGNSGDIVFSGMSAGPEGYVVTVKYRSDSPKVTLGYARQGAGAGTVTLSPGGALSGSSSRSYELGALVTLSAWPEADSVFTGWGGACSGTGTCTVTMNEATTISATFEHKAIPLNYTRLGEGTGRLDLLPGSTCFGNCTQYYDAGASVTLTAAATGTSVFTGWSGACSGTGVCTVLMDQVKEVAATFSHGPRVSYYRAGTGAGSVKFSIAGVDSFPLPPDRCTENCTRDYSVGIPLVITAQSYPGTTFTGWSGACTGTGACTVTMTADVAVTANFAKVASKISLAAGYDHTLALFGDTLYGWGDNSVGQLGNVFPMIVPRPFLVEAPPLVKVVAAKAGFASAGIGPDGSLWDSGDGAITWMGESAPSVSELVDIAQGTMHSLAVRADGSLISWGYNYAGQLGVVSDPTWHPPTVLPSATGFVAVAAGGMHSVALKADGTVWAWGYNAHGQTGIDPALLADPSIPRQVEGISGATAIAAGLDHTLVLKGDGTVVSWGLNDFGQLGDGGLTERSIPQTVPGLGGVTAIAAGGGFSMALKNDGTLWMWGENGLGQLGTGNTVNQLLPVQVQGLPPVISIAGGQYHAVAAESDGSVWAWGNNGMGELGDGSGYQRNAPVRVDFFARTFPQSAPITTASPAGGSYTSAQTVTLTPNKSATIYYTLDGSTPTTASAVYTAPLTISSATVLKYFAVDTDHIVESVKTRTYTFPVVADFTSQATAGNAPLTVSFSDLTTGNPTSWLWSFGDGATDTAQNPVHVYSGAGSYTVSLTAAKTGATDTKTKHRHITVQKCEDAPVRVRGAMVTSFADLVTAYAQAADNDVLELQEYNFSDSLLFDREIRLSLKGGYNCGYQDNPAAAGIYGKLTIKAGTVKLENIRLR